MHEPSFDQELLVLRTIVALLLVAGLLFLLSHF